jgi:hypothetical protein
MIINSFQIDTSEMSHLEQDRRFTVNGKIGATFTIVALQNPSSSSAHTLYYDFTSGAFESGHNDQHNNLTVTLSSRVYKSSIKFPSGGGTFVIKLITANGTTTNSVNSNVISRSISKLSTITTLTFQAETSNTNSYETFPSTTSTGTSNSSGSVSFDWAITNKKTDANGFGLLQNTSSTFDFDLTLESTIVPKIQNAWYFKATDTVDGAITSATQFKVDDLTDLVVGMQITGVSLGSSLTGEPFITSINTGDKTITISSAQTFADGITLTFKAYGIDSIQSAIGAVFEFPDITITPTTITKAMRVDTSGDDGVLGLVDTYGIAGGNLVTFLGVGVDNSGSNRVSEVTTADVDGSNGVITVERAQLLSQGVVLTFIGSFAIINFSGNIIVNSYPNADRTINFDIDKFLSVGEDD